MSEEESAGAATPRSALSLLAIVADEMRETATLLRVDGAATARKPLWRYLVWPFAREAGEVARGQSIQYLGQNIDRARDHWREAVRLVDHLDPFALTDHHVDGLRQALQSAGIDTVLPRLQHDVIPGPTAQAASHLAEVTSVIRECVQLVARTQQLILLQRVRDEGT